MALDILLTNDDGYASPGIQALYEALLAAGENVHVVAPQANQSAQGSSLGGLAALDRPLAYTEFSPGNYYVDGRPVSAVLVGLEVLDLFGGEPPDVVISGTNRGENVGESNNISGTVNAAVAALREGVPAIALSAGSSGGSYDAAYANAAEFLVGLLDALEADRAEGAPLLPAGQGLSLNIPGDPDPAGLAVTRIDQESSAAFPIVQRPSGLYGSDFIPNAAPSGNPVSEGAQFLADRLTVAPIDGDWTAPDSVRLDLAARLDDRLGDGDVSHAGPLSIMLVDEQGAEAAGLQALRDALVRYGHDVTVVAPATDQTGVGTALTLADFAVAETEQGYAVAATPATTVYTALDALLTGDDRPGLIISGIDAGPSLGLQAAGSATLAAAIAGVFNYGVPSIAVSAEGGADAADADFVAELVAELRATAASDGALLPPGIGLNVNLPAHADPGRVSFTRADASTDAELRAVPTGTPGEARLAFDGPVETGDPDAEGNAFLAGDITITSMDGNYGSGDLGVHDRIAALLGAPFGLPSDEVPFLAPAAASAASTDFALA